MHSITYDSTYVHIKYSEKRSYMFIASITDDDKKELCPSSILLAESCQQKNKTL